MISAKAPYKALTPEVSPIKVYSTGFGLLAALILLTYICLLQAAAPQPAPADAAAGEFSAYRAMSHIGAIAQSPHSSGTPEHALVRDYLVQQLMSLGLDTRLQTTPTVTNILGRLAGTEAGKALMLAGHYDTVKRSPGANDDSASVAAILETVRALKEGTPLKNDLIILFTDGEERGLLGAKEFTGNHEWARDVRLALNFEARGSSGPSLMFQTSTPNGHLVREFAASAPYPVANSLMAEIYKSLPNDTDFTVFNNAGIKGFNFAYIEGYEHYHRQSDSVENVSHQTLQHHGSYALALSRHFGNLDLEVNDPSNAVYFNLGTRLIHYPAGWSLLFSSFVGLVFFLVAFAGLRKKRLTISGILIGLLAILASVLVSAGLIFLVASIVGSPDSGARPALASIEVSRNLYIIGCLAIAVAVISATTAFIQRFITQESLACGGLLLWLALMAVASVLLPLGSYIFTWPLLFGLSGFAFVLMSERGSEATVVKALVLLATALPIFILLVPILHTIFLGFTLAGAPLAIAAVAISLSLLIPHLNLITHGKKWLLPSASAVAGITLIVAVSLWRAQA